MFEEPLGKAPTKAKELAKVTDKGVPSVSTTLEADPGIDPQKAWKTCSLSFCLKCQEDSKKAPFAENKADFLISYRFCVISTVALAPIRDGIICRVSATVLSCPHGESQYLLTEKSHHLSYVLNLFPSLACFQLLMPAVSEYYPSPFVL